MISQDGAALVANVYPVAMLVIGLEVRAVPKLYPTTMTAFVVTGVFAAALIITLGAGFNAIYKCMVAVSAGVSLDGWDATAVTVAGHCLGNLAVLLMMMVVADRFGLFDRLASVHIKKISDSPRRVSAFNQRLERFSPSLRKDDATN